MGATVHIDTDAANKALDELIAKAKRVQVASNNSTAIPDPAAIAQAQRRWNRRNGITTEGRP